MALRSFTPPSWPTLEGSIAPPHGIAALAGQQRSSQRLKVLDQTCLDPVVSLPLADVIGDREGLGWHLAALVAGLAVPLQRLRPHHRQFAAGPRRHPLAPLLHMALQWP